MTISKYIYTYIHINQYLSSYLIKYSESENVSKSSDIKHDIIRCLMEEFNIPHCEIGSIADIPGKTGLGSSSAFTASLVGIILNYKGKNFSKKELAEIVCDIELNKLKFNIGLQDTYSTVFGGVNQFNFTKNQVTQEPLNLNHLAISKIERNSILIKTVFNENRSASNILLEIQKEKNMDTQKKILELVEEFKPLILEGNIGKMGEVLNSNWEYKKFLNPEITNPTIDAMYKKLMEYGGLGGKLLGAGSTGYLFMFMPEKKIKSLKVDFPDLLIEEIKIDYDGFKILI